MAEIINNDKLILESRKRLSMTNVEAVNGFTDTFLNLTVCGKQVKIIGAKLKITSYNKNTGNLTCDGEINEIKYSGAKQSVFKKVFK